MLLLIIEIYIGIILGLSYLSFYIYNKFTGKFIVISKNHNILKLHSNVVTLSKAKNIKYNLIKQYHSQTLNGFPVYKDVSIIRFDQYI
tara:strand:+ start:2379 stop:2642 length:264 start_codon:yes stop_codon:yes gene_type:complete